MLRNRKTNDPTTFDISQVDSTPLALQASDSATSGNQTGEASSTTHPIVGTSGCTTHTTHCSFTSEKDKMAPPASTMGTDLVSHSDFVKTTEKIIEKLDTLNTNVTVIRNEVSEMRANMSDLQAAVADSRERLTAIESDILPKMQKKNENLENELKQMIMALELHDRKMNLLMYGVEKKKDERVVEVVRSIIHELGFSKEEAQNMYIANAHRLPRRVTPGSDESRRGHDPIIVRFGSMFDRDAVLNAYQRVPVRPMTPQGQPAVRHAFRIVTDLPAPLKRKRFLLEQRAYQMRKNENKSTRIKLNGVNLQLECREKGSSSAWRIVLD